MKRTCTKCRSEINDDERIFCSCGEPLSKVAGNLLNVTHEQEVKIAERVSSTLESSKDFKNKVINGLINRTLGVIIVNIVQAITGHGNMEAIPSDNGKVFLWEKAGLNKDESSFDEIKSHFYSLQSAPPIQALILDAIYRLERIPKYDRLNLMVDVFQTSPNLSIRFKAQYYLEQESKYYSNLPDMYHQINWWNANKDRLAKEASASPK